MERRGSGARWTLFGVAALVLVGAAFQEPARYHGFALATGDWVVVDGLTGASCRYDASVDTAERVRQVTAAIAQAQARGDTAQATALLVSLERADCRLFLGMGRP